jgi:hypothetical protein
MDDDFYQWYLLVKEAKEIGLTVDEIKNWFNEMVVSKKETG